MLCEVLKAEVVVFMVGRRVIIQARRVRAVRVESGGESNSDVDQLHVLRHSNCFDEEKERDDLNDVVGE